MSSPLKDQIMADMKAAMKAGETEKRDAIRLLTAAIKQKEVDTRETLDDTTIIDVIGKMLKQRRDSITQYKDAGRDELAAKEEAEIAILQTYLPEQLSDEEIDGIVKAAVKETGASEMKDMGKVMGIIKPKLQGRADIGQVSAKVKQHLGA